MLSSLGVKLSDVFGADNILWVEGETEEIVFPNIVKKILNKSLWGTKIACVTHTGDFEQKNTKKVENIFKIYSKLSNSASLLPPALGFVFDREDRTEKEIEDMLRTSKDKETQKPMMHFLNRRLYENYLINSKAIYHVLKTELSHIEDAKNVKLEEIEEWISNHFYEQKYLDISKQKDMMLKWLESKGIALEAINLDKIKGDKLGPDFVLNFFHGAKFLKELFAEFLIEFDKTKHSVMLSNWLIDNEPKNLIEVGELINRIIE